MPGHPGLFQPFPGGVDRAVRRRVGGHAKQAQRARARTIGVTLWKASDRYLLEVTDDGQGFDFEKMKLSIGHGLANMQTRARNVGGDIDFSSEPGSGTTILAWVPAAVDEPAG